MVPDETGYRVYPNPLRPDTDLDGATDHEEYLAVPRTDPTENVSQPPSLESIAVTAEGIVATLEAAFSDPDPGDRVAALLVDWGDGGALEAVPVAVGETTALVTHAYASLGAYTIAARVVDLRDEESGPRTATVTLTVPTAGLMSYWPMNGNTDDQTGGYDAGFNSDQYGVDRFGNAGSAALLDFGPNDLLGVIDAPHVPFTGSFTIAAWTSADSQGNNERIAGQGDWFSLYFGTSNRVAFGIVSAGLPDPTVFVQAPDTVDGRHADDVWTLYVGVVEAGVGTSTLRLYKDGVEVAAKTLNQSFTNPGSCRFYMGDAGENSCNGQPAENVQRFDGLVDDVRIYGRALSAGEVSLLDVEPDTHAVVP